MTREQKALIALVVVVVLGLLVLTTNLLGGLVVLVLGLAGWVVALRGTHPKGPAKPGLDEVIGTAPTAVGTLPAPPAAPPRATPAEDPPVVVVAPPDGGEDHARRQAQ